jgi:selenocysteine lyase/cysteine desulfurase
MYWEKDRNIPAVPSDRRGFLKQLLGSAAALSVFPNLKTTASSAELVRAATRLADSDTIGEPFWRMVKEQFTIKEGFILLNAANLCPAPHLVQEKVSSLTRDLDGDVSFQNRAKFSTLLEESRKKLAAYVGASEDEIAIVRNTSEANNIIVGGLALKAGDEVVILDQNHPTNNVAWDVRAARFGFSVKRVSLTSPPASPEEILKTFRDALTTKTKVLAFSDVSNSTGVRLPTKELCRLAHERGIYSHVDGAQTFGALQINVREMGCNSYSASSHKWFMGPKEAGLLYVRRERIADIWPGVVGVGWGEKAETSARGARKFETLGQRDDATLAAMATTVDFHNLIGPARIEARVRQLTTLLKDGLSKLPGAVLLTSMNPELSAGVCVVRFDGLDQRKIYETLYTKHNIAGATVGGLRFSPHIYNTVEEIERTIAAVGQIVNQERSRP